MFKRSSLYSIASLTETKDSSLGINFVLGPRDQTQPGSLSLSLSLAPLGWVGGNPGNEVVGNGFLITKFYELARRKVLSHIQTSRSWLKVPALVFQTHFSVFWVSEKHSFSCLIFHFSVFSYQMNLTPSGVGIHHFSIVRYRMKHSFSCLRYHFSVLRYRMKHPFLWLIYYFSMFANRKNSSSRV